MINRLFVYGSLAPGQPNDHYLSHLNGSWQKANIRGVLHEKGWGNPAIILDENVGEVPGHLFTSDDLEKEWETLDAFEGDAYKRVTGNVILEDGSNLKAWVYSYNNKPTT